MSDEWTPSHITPSKSGPYLVYMPDREIDEFSVQYWHHIDGWESNYGISHWRPLPSPPSA